ncbi:MAG TPA: HlyD family efflux transporter periplasmic adaptor subunit [Arenimonas sp.]|uniref:HlyD family secretion protein n=1 Tax=Arenimonas sp. TaxID=1872635 RepID=UPI002C292ACD|nr:HlyD family efflux transporter periplasmic adaptor subunit [Arenimonas sp.]HMB57487.1 HlyD family efflux transporter periplasmic adaptor subunit [Arenimonas sp.]
MSVPATATNPKRQRALTIIAVIVIVVAIVYAIYWFLYLSHYESTDDAYVQGNIVQITPQLAGTVVQVKVQDTDQVKAGQTLVELDPADARVALEEAEAALAQTVREVRQIYGNDAAMQADLAFRQADAARSAADLLRVQQDLRRRQDLAMKGVISKEDLAHSLATVTAAQSAQHAALAAVDGSREQLQATRSITRGVAINEHPKIKAAAAKVHEAMLALQRTQLLAPVGGYVAKRSVQLGQRVQPGANMMAIVPLDQVWVDANFKEVQLRKMRIGQPVALTADVYGKDVAYRGRIAGLGAGTGAAFALIPAQNATGNWIKVVQRVPVRIALDPAQLREHPLRVGLSMQVEVDVGDQAGKPVTETTAAASDAPVLISAVDAQADAIVQRIIADNLGAAVVAKASSH